MRWRPSTRRGCRKDERQVPSAKGLRDTTMSFLAALHFLTTIPVGTRQHFTDAELGASLAYYPLVGALMGVLLAVAASLLAVVFERHVTAALVMLVGVMLTGGLHLDGFM